VKERIVYLTMPEDFHPKVKPGVSWVFDPTIPLPVEVPSGEAGVSVDNISIERVLAGMLRVLTFEGGSLHRRYYRDFVLACRPAIKEELQGAAILKSKNQDFENAHDIIDILKALYPGDAAVLLVEATTLEDEASAATRQRAVPRADATRLWEAAGVAYEAACDAPCALPDALFNAAFFYKRRRDYARAKELFGRYARISTDDDKREKAIKMARAIERFELDDECFSTAYHLIKNGDEVKGMNILRHYIERHSDNWHGWFLLGWALRKQRRWHDAAAALLKALDTGGARPDTHNELAICLLEMGDANGAKRELEAALAQDGENIKIISNLAVLALRRGDVETARAFFRAILEIDPTDPLALHYLHNAKF
jgi:tetratricopeptide (TPR) repeat protein